MKLSLSFGRLFLRSSLYYRKEPLEPFPGTDGKTGSDGKAGFAGESLFCFALEPGEAFRIDPGTEPYLGPLLAAGTGPAASDMLTGMLELKAGTYYFTQVRQELNRTQSIEAAIELQKEALWERLKPKETLFIRRLFEDGSPVTQLFRPLSATV